MRIAQIAPLWETFPPRAYGGTELVVHLLTENMVKRGHEVTLFGAGGSRTEAHFRCYSARTLRELETEIKRDKTHCTVMASELLMLSDLYRSAHQFDMIHNHLGFQALPFGEALGVPMVTTLHNALAPEPVKTLFYRHASQPMIAISNYQQTLWPGLNYAATIYHGIDLDCFEPDLSQDNKNYLAFFGRLSPEKGPHHAVHIAKQLNMPLILAGKLDRVDRDFYNKAIAPHIDGEQIQYIGELTHAEKVTFLRGAAATLCPVEWPEPFGLVMIESMACGTPVFALRDGSVPEVIDHGRSGYVADSVGELAEAVRQWRQFDRVLVRRTVESRFGVDRMVAEHLQLYEQLIQQHHKRPLRRKNQLSVSQGYAWSDGQLINTNGRSGLLSNEFADGHSDSGQLAVGWL